MENATDERWTVHIEVRLKSRVSTRFDTLRSHVHDYLITSFDRITLPSVLEGWEDTPILNSTVERIVACETVCPLPSLSIPEISFQIHLYQPSDSDTFEEFTNSSGPRMNGDDDTVASTVCDLPNRSLEGLWESLIYADDVKMKMLDYIHATFVLSDADIDFNLVSWNRVALLHGPPGTGKTSLCKALAQKLAIRLSHRYSQCRLLEINSHSLFSRWFSESGKLVQRLFSGITDLIEDEDAFVVILIDEVESLTAARAGAMAGTEPSDGLRVVNALLTQLDKLKHRKNVLVMATSNLMKAIDCAFVDRADIVHYIDLPPREAVYDILRTCLCEMMTKKLVQPIDVPTLAQARMYERSNSFEDFLNSSTTVTETPKYMAYRLLCLASECQKQGLSGRALRRLPVQALARYIGRGSAAAGFYHGPPEAAPLKCDANGTAVKGSADRRAADVIAWLDAMRKVLEERTLERREL